MAKVWNMDEALYDLAEKIIKTKFEYSNATQDEIDAYRDGLIKGMEEMYEMMANATEDFLKETFESGFDEYGSHHVISKESMTMEEFMDLYKKEIYE